MNRRPFFFFALALFGAPLFGGGESHAASAANLLCESLVLRAAKLSFDPGHARLLSPLNRFMALQKQASNPADFPEPLPSPIGARVRPGEYPPGSDFGPEQAFSDAVASIEAAGGRVHLTDDSHAQLILGEFGEAVVLLPRLKPGPLVMAHVFEHFTHWSEVVRELSKEMAPNAAAHLALSLMNTPEGAWIAEHRAVRAQLSAAEEQGLLDLVLLRQSRGLTPAQALAESNYPALVAIEQTFRLQLILDQETYSERPELAPVLEQARLKLVADLELFLDETVNHVVLDWDRQVRLGERRVGARPSTFEDFFGTFDIRVDQPEHERVAQFFQELTVKYLQEAVERRYSGQQSGNPAIPLDRPRKGWLRFFR